MINVPRRKLALIGAVFAAALFTQTRRAFADTAFTAFAFTSTNGTQARTMPNRLNDFINVLDWGADPTGVADSAPSINAAIASKVTANNMVTGTIYIPKGTYKINSKIGLPPAGVTGTVGLITNGFIVRGDGASATILTGNFNGFILDTDGSGAAANAGGYYIEDMTVINTNTTAKTSGAIRFTGMGGGAIKRVIASGMVGITTELAGENDSRTQFVSMESILINSQPALGAIGIVLHGDNMSLSESDVSGIGVGVLVANGNGMALINNHFEVNTTAIKIGLMGDGTTPGSVTGAVFLTNAFEGNGIAIDLVGSLSGAIINGANLHGEITTIGGVAAQTSSFGFRFPDDKLINSYVLGISGAGDFTGSIISIGGCAGSNGGRGGNVFQGLYPGTPTSGGTAFSFPTGTAGAAAIGPFIGCNAVPAWTFNNLPSSSVALDGEEHSIVDSPTAASGNFAANVTVGGGSNHVKVRWNAGTSKWTICG